MAAPHDFKLDDRDFWEDPWREPPRRGLLPEVPTASGIEIAAPAFVPLRGRTTLPILARRSATHAELAESSFTHAAIVTAVDLDRNRFFAGYACDHEGLAARRDAPRAAPPRGRMLERQLIDLRARAALPWVEARYRISILLGATVSNAVETRLVRSLGGYSDEAVAQFIAARRERPTGLHAQPRAEFPYPSYAQAPTSPSPPRPRGINLSLEMPGVVRPGSRVVLRCAARLPIPRGDRLPAPREDEPPALAGMHLLVTGERTPAPRILSMRVPVQPPLGDGDAPLGVLFFSIDLMGLGTAWPAERHHVYAWSRDAFAGPLSFDLSGMNLDAWR